jgi:hypothetical protein
LATPSYALSSGDGTMIEQGFDTACDPTTSQTQAFWLGTPYWWIGTYIGGIDMLCNPQPNLSASWLNTVNGQGWQFEFIWVGPQPPGTAYANQFSTNPTTAYSQGKTEGVNAYVELSSTLAVSNSAANTAVVYDLDAVNTQYQSAVNSFISGWIYQLHLPTAQTAGVYGSVCGANLGALATLSPPPDFIWGAWYNGNMSTSNLDGGGCGVPNGDWASHQRLKQYNNTHKETWNNVALYVDDDCANGPTSPAGSGVYHNNGCL